MKYEFHVGDYVETKDGRIGYITKICHCEFCKDRGFYEPYVRYNDGEEEYITVHEVEHFQDFYNRIGQYDFSKSEQPKEIERLQDDLTARFELPNGRAMILKTYTDSKDFVEASYSRELINKINELVDAVNELMEAKNDESIS